MSTETITDQFTELVEHFEDEVPCRAKGHDHPADWAFSHGHDCGYAQSSLICDQRLQVWIADAESGFMVCSSCRAQVPRTYAQTNAKWISL